MRWVEPQPVSEAAVRALEDALGVRGELAELLVRRGCRDPEAARRFLRPELSTLHAASGLPDLEPAVRRLERAVDRGETLLVHGDYDADGMCAAALLVRSLRDVGGELRAFVPQRGRDGYGLGEAGIGRARGLGASVIVTADCGTTAHGPVKRAGEAGMDVVVTDHHRPDDELPPAAAVVNPSRRDSRYPFAGLAGVGVAFKLASEIQRRRGLAPERMNQHLDLVALGTVADRMPLTDENRTLVRAGLSALRRSRKPGIRALLSTSGWTEEHGLDSEWIAYRLAPRLNAAGRVGSAEHGLRLLLTDDPEEAARLARRLERANRRRRKEDRRVAREAEATLASAADGAPAPAVVLWAEDWPEGVLGIAASRLVERLRRPAALVSFSGDVGRGSARSPDGFHLHRALAECDDLLERYGGHPSAAGFEVRRDRVEAFARRFRRLAERELGTETPEARLPIDLDVPLGSVDEDLHGWLDCLAPFGEENPRPVLRTRGVAVQSIREVGRDGDHLNLRLAADDAALEAVGFGMGSRAEALSRGGRWDVAYELDLNYWKGERRLQARLRDVRREASGPGGAP